MKIKTPDEKYLEQAKRPAESDAERVLSRMRGKLNRRFEDAKLSVIEALAIQLEREDEHLKEWRARMVEIKMKFD